MSSRKTYPAIPFVKPKGRAMRLLAVILPPVVFFIGLALIYAWVRSGLPAHRQFLMPSGWALWDQAFGIAEVRAEIAERALTTLGIALAGLAISMPLGMLLAIIMFRDVILERALFPNIVLNQAIPTLAVIPLIQTALGFGLLPKVLIVANFTLFSIPITLLLGLKSVDRGIINLFRLQGASWTTTLVKACLPAAAPALFSGLRIAASMAVLSAIVSELFFLAGRGGLGQMIINAKIDFKYEQMYAGILVATLMSLAVYVAFTWAGNKLFADWHESSAPKT